MQRNLTLDIIRIFACLLIVCMHSPMPTTSENGFILLGISYLSAPAIGLFFMISGALLLPVKSETAPFLKKRVSKLAWPAVVWSFLYMLVHYLRHQSVPTIKEVLSIPFSPDGSPILWFLYAMIGLYMVAPVISPWLERISYKTAKLYLYIFLIAFCITIISQFLYVDVRPEGMLYYFIGYIGYFYIGWFITRYPGSIQLWQAGIGMIVSILTAIVCKLWFTNVDFYQLFWYKSIFVLMMVVFWFKLFMKLESRMARMSDRTKKMLILVSNLSFGIYLCHFMILRSWLWQVPFFVNIESYWLQTLALIIAAFILSVTISYLISLLPFAKYIIGFRSRG